MRITLMGSAELAIPTLEALLDAGHMLPCVYTAPPQKAGRKQQQPTPLHLRAQQLGIPVRYPENFQNSQTQTDFAALKTDLALVIAYGLILPQSVLQTPQMGCLNLHASSLPRWRGAAPVQRAIMAGDTETALQLIYMQAGLDTGPIMLSQTIPLSETDTAGDILTQMSKIGPSLAMQAIKILEQGKPVFTPQNQHGTTHAHKIMPQETRINWNKPAHVVRNQIHALSPKPGAWCENNQIRLKILRAQTEIHKSGQPGQTLDDNLLIACKTGALRILELQRSGKNTMNSADFLRGSPLHAGTILH